MNQTPGIEKWKAVVVRMMSSITEGKQLESRHGLIVDPCCSRSLFKHIVTSLLTGVASIPRYVAFMIK